MTNCINSNKVRPPIISLPLSLLHAPRTLSPIHFPRYSHSFHLDHSSVVCFSVYICLSTQQKSKKNPLLYWIVLVNSLADLQIQISTITSIVYLWWQSWRRLKLTRHGRYMFGEHCWTGWPFSSRSSLRSSGERLRSLRSSLMSACVTAPSFLLLLTLRRILSLCR